MITLKTILTIVIPLFELLGFLTAIRAIMEIRSSQGAIAWAISLITFPYIAVPLYWVFGRNKFQGYVEALRSKRFEKKREIKEIPDYINVHKCDMTGDCESQHVFINNLTLLPFTNNNNVKLLINGKETYQAIFDCIEQAQGYVLLQYYIVREDQTGLKLKELLIKKAKEKVRIYFLYDEIGCHALSPEYINDLINAGVQMEGFKTTKGRLNQFQLNFRNHRKIVIIDGVTGFLGGLNIGDEYLGRNKKLSPWRDTHIQILGPAVQAIQLSFFSDWRWANEEVPDVDWTPHPVNNFDQKVSIIPTGPTDDKDACALLFTHLINSAKKRLWIATPYFVHDEAIINALKLADLRGVDVRIILPRKNDLPFVHLAAYS